MGCHRIRTLEVMACRGLSADVHPLTTSNATQRKIQSGNRLSLFSSASLIGSSWGNASIDVASQILLETQDAHAVHLATCCVLASFDEEIAQTSVGHCCLDAIPRALEGVDGLA